MQVTTNVHDVESIELKEVVDLKMECYTRVIVFTTKDGKYEVTAFSGSKEALSVGTVYHEEVRKDIRV